jgi:hypothetical protein
MLQLYQYPDESFAARKEERMEKAKKMNMDNSGWLLKVEDSDHFEGTFRIELDYVPDHGHPRPFG